MKSIGKMIELIHGLCDTKDVTPWENEIIKNVHATYLARGKTTTHLTGRQAEIIEQIYTKNFG